MKISDCKTILTACINASRRVLLVGPPGIGKTAIVKEVQKELNADLTVIYGSISDPTDFKGLPCIIDGKPEIKPFGELERIFNADKLHIVFADDIGQGAPAVQAAQMSFLDRVKANKNVVVIGATNRREDRAGVSGLLEPIKSRFDSIIHVDFDMEDWIDTWALDNLPVELVAFNKFRPGLMYSGNPTADLVNNPCPRTVESLGALMGMNIPLHLQLETYKGAVGEGYAAEFIGFMQIYTKLPSIDAILLHPDAIEMPTQPAVIYALSLGLARKASQNTIERILKFTDRMPPEFQVLMIRDAVKHGQTICNTKAFIVWSAKHQDTLI